MLSKPLRFFLIIFVVSLTLFSLADYPLSSREPILGQAFAATAGKVAGTPVSFADLVEKWRPTVVNISTTTIVKGRQGNPLGNEMPFQRFFGKDDFFRRFFEDAPEREFKQRSLG